jgi:transposase
MLNLPATTRVFLHREPVDFRKSHDGLCGVIRSGLGRDPLSGDLFVFLNKRRNRVKLIQWDGNGLWLHYKRLEKGTFRALRAAHADGVTLSRGELSMLLDGIEIKKGEISHRFPAQLRIPERAV